MVELTATASEFSYFLDWSTPCTGMDPCTLSITSNTLITAFIGKKVTMADVLFILNQMATF